MTILTSKCQNSKRREKSNTRNQQQQPQVAAVTTQPTTTTQEQVDNAQLGTLSGSWFLINGHYAQSQYSRPQVQPQLSQQHNQVQVLS